MPVVREITAGEDITACCWGGREAEEIDVGKRPRAGVVELVVGRGEGGGRCMLVSGGRRARLWARVGIGRTSDGLRVIAIAIALALAAS